MLSYYNRGSLLLIVSLAIFSIALTTAGFIWFQLRGLQTSGREPPQTSPSPLSSRLDVLNPTIDIDTRLADQTNVVHANLIDPLRQYYATQDKQLKHVAVTATEDEAYPASVTLTIGSGGLSGEEISFLYNLTRWTPSMLDNQREESE